MDLLLLEDNPAQGTTGKKDKDRMEKLEYMIDASLQRQGRLLHIAHEAEIAEALGDASGVATTSRERKQTKQKKG